MKAALYIRVSTEDQAISGFSLPAQLSLLNEYCTRNNIEVSGTYIDEGISGQKENRPQFQKVISDAEKGLFNIILVHKFDRFARKVELSQRVKNQLAKCNVALISITEPLEDSPMGFFVGGLHDLMSEYFVRNLSVEVKKGMVKRAALGLNNGRAPFGYTMENKTLIVNPNEAPVVKKIFEMYIEGKGKQAIASWLNENRIKLNGRDWGYSDVNRILTCQKYIGNIYYAEKVYPGQHEPILDIDIFDQAQKIRERKFTPRKPQIGDNFLLLGLLKCGYCGRAIRIKARKTKNDKVWYYACNGLARLKSFCPQSRYWPQQKIEKDIIITIKDMLKTSNFTIKTANKTSMANVITQSKISLEKEIERAEKAYLAGVFSLEKYIKIKKNNEDKIKEYDTTIKDEMLKQEDDNKRQEIKTMLQAFNKAKTIPEKKKILCEHIQCIKIGDTIDIIYY